MNNDIELDHGSGNVFRDLGLPSPEILQLKAKLATQIIKVLDKRQLTVRDAHDRTGVAAADFSRIRGAKLSRFTVDRLMLILARLDQSVEVSVKVRPRRGTAQPASRPA